MPFRKSTNYKVIISLTRSERFASDRKKQASIDATFWAEIQKYILKWIFSNFFGFFKLFKTNKKKLSSFSTEKFSTSYFTQKMLSELREWWKTGASESIDLEKSWSLILLFRRSPTVMDLVRCISWAKNKPSAKRFYGCDETKPTSSKHNLSRFERMHLRKSSFNLTRFECQGWKRSDKSEKRTPSPYFDQ